MPNLWHRPWCQIKVLNPEVTELRNSIEILTAGDNSPPGGGRVCGGLLLVHHEVQREELHRVLVSGLSQQPAGEGQLGTVSSWTTLQLTVTI